LGVILKTTASKLRLPPKPLTPSRYVEYDDRAEMTVTRNTFLPVNIPKFSEQGFKIMDIPKDFYEEIRAFYYQYLHTRLSEGQIMGIVNTEEVDLFLIYLDNNATFRDMISNKYMKPILEEWSGLELRLTSGLRCEQSDLFATRRRFFSSHIHQQRSETS